MISVINCFYFYLLNADEPQPRFEMKLVIPQDQVSLAVFTNQLAWHLNLLVVPGSYRLNGAEYPPFPPLSVILGHRLRECRFIDGTNPHIEIIAESGNNSKLFRHITQIQMLREDRRWIMTQWTGDAGNGDTEPEIICVGEYELIGSAVTALEGWLYKAIKRSLRNGN